MRLGCVITLLLSLLAVNAQNMTDLAVMNDRSAEGRVVQSDYSTVDDSVFIHPDRIRFDDRCVQIDGKDLFVLSGTFHYFRTPQPLWRDRLQKLKDGGFNCVETYVPWNWHEQEMPASPDDYSKVDMTELEQFLSLADSLGLYSIIRPGPYICAEWSGGGFPQWLMAKKPAQPKYEVWLQSNDPVFMQWNEHWYKAVCEVVKTHQIQNRPKGQGGVILFQVENEFNRIKWFPKEAKRDYLEQLTRIARREGIEVPIITCWTSEARNVKEGPLNGVVDMVNSYPRWNIEKNFRRLINQQLKSQPGKPLISGELQGGWYSDVGGKLSHEQDGVAAVQTQNILLYALQRGFCAVNFYMAVGGTNFDDWAARDITTTYDFAAAIGEDGTLTERYYRLQALAPFIYQHGTRIARAKELYPAYSTTDTLVQLALRQTADGDRYYFIRTEDYSRRHEGTIQVDGLSIPFHLEPFGSMVYFVEHDAPITMGTIEDPLPTRWQPVTQKELRRHLTYYRTYAPSGSLLQVGRTSKGIVNGSSADEVMVWADGKNIEKENENEEYVSFRLPKCKRKQVEVLMLYDPKGLHHHTNKQVEEHWNIGPTYVKANGKELSLEMACTERETGIRLSQSTQITQRDRPYCVNLLTWHVGTFAPVTADAVCHLHIKHTGNGFLYVNGHPIGRVWEEGPQRDYYIPECWLHKDKPNHVAVSLYGSSTKCAIYLKTKSQK